MGEVLAEYEAYGRQCRIVSGGHTFGTVEVRSGEGWSWLRPATAAEHCLIERLHAAAPLIAAAPKDGNGEPLYLGCRRSHAGQHVVVEELSETEAMVCVSNEEGDDYGRVDVLELE